MAESWTDKGGIPFGKRYDEDFNKTLDELYHYIEQAAILPRNPMAVRRALVCILELMDINLMRDPKMTDDILAIFDKVQKDEAKKKWRLTFAPEP